MRFSFKCFCILFAVVVVAIMSCKRAKSQVFRLDYPEVGLAILDRHVADHDWSPDGRYITYSKRNVKDWYFDIRIVTPNGTGHQCLTCGNRGKGFPRKHTGGVTWHPSRKFLVFVAQNNDAEGEHIDQLAQPGVGLNCNLWAIEIDGNGAWQLTDIETDYGAPRGVIHPQFSNDGRRLFWAEATGNYKLAQMNEFAWGEWTLVMGDLLVGGGVPRLENVRRFQLGKQYSFYESHDWSPDDAKILFTGNLTPGQSVNGLDVYEYAIATGRLKRLTSSFDDWDEHAHYSPDGKTIAWMSGAGLNVEFGSVRFPGWMNYVKTELWLMNRDGSNQRRITFFNEPGHPDHEWFARNIYDSPRVIVSDNSWSPDGKTIAVTLAFEGPSKIIGSLLVLVDLDKRR